MNGMSLWNRFKSNSAVVLLSKTINAFGEDNGSLLAAGVAYNLLFSIFPFALVTISVAGFFMESPRFETQVINAIANLIPVARDMLETNLHEVVRSRAETGVVAVALLIWSASSFFNALRKSLNKAWGIKAEVSFFRGQAKDIAMLIGSFILLLLYMWLSTLVRIIHATHFHSEDFQFLNSTTISSTIFSVSNVILAFGVILLLYKFIPSHNPHWKDIWPGALLAAASVEIIRFGFIWYIGDFSNYNLVYGSIGAVIALLAFIYLSAWALLFFAELSATSLSLKSR
jgi:membrane protein